MSEEEAIKYLTNIKDDIFIHLKNHGWIYDINRIIDVDNAIIAIETVLNMLDKQDKIIRAMAEEILIKRTWVLNEEEIEEDKDSIIREYEDKVENEIYI